MRPQRISVGSAGLFAGHSEGKVMDAPCYVQGIGVLLLQGRRSEGQTRENPAPVVLTEASKGEGREGNAGGCFPRKPSHHWLAAGKACCNQPDLRGLGQKGEAHEGEIGQLGAGGGAARVTDVLPCHHPMPAAAAAAAVSPSCHEQAPDAWQPAEKIHPNEMLPRGNWISSVNEAIMLIGLALLEARRCQPAAAPAGGPGSVSLWGLFPRNAFTRARGVGSSKGTVATELLSEVPAELGGFGDIA